LTGVGAQLAIHLADDGSHLFRDLFDVATRHFKLRAPELCLNVPRVAVLLEVRWARSAERLVGHVGDSCALRQGLQVALQVISDAKGCYLSGVNYFSRSATIISPDQRQLQP
jgi:hypothetical protein